MADLLPVTITLNGCDDSTHIDVELNAEQYELVDWLCIQSQERSTYTCQPTMSVELKSAGE